MVLLMYSTYFSTMIKFRRRLMISRELRALPRKTEDLREILKEVSPYD